jgi:hypothetical protein
MKRNEMVKILFDEISEFTDQSCCFLGFNQSEASRILNVLEDLGMVPPDTDNEDDAIISLPVWDDGEIVCRQCNGWDKE